MLRPVSNVTGIAIQGSVLAQVARALTGRGDAAYLQAIPNLITGKLPAHSIKSIKPTVISPSFHSFMHTRGPWRLDEGSLSDSMTSLHQLALPRQDDADVVDIVETTPAVTA